MIPGGLHGLSGYKLSISDIKARVVFVPAQEVNAERSLNPNISAWEALPPSFSLALTLQATGAPG